MDVPLLDAECMRIPGGPKPVLTATQGEDDGVVVSR